MTEPYSQRLPLGARNAAEALRIAAAVVRSMGWNVTGMNDGALVAGTGVGSIRFKIWVHDGWLYYSSASVLPVEDSDEVNIHNVHVFEEAFQRRLAEEDELDRIVNSQAETAQEPYQQPEPVYWGPERILSLWRLVLPNKQFLITPFIVDGCITVFITMCLFGVSFIDPSSNDLIRWGANYSPLTLAGEWWRLLTAVFIHVGVLHLGLNLFGLVYVAIFLEPLLGRVRFLLAFLITGILASVSSLWWHDIIISAGASGAIFGLYGVFIALLTTDLVEKAARTTFLAYFAVIIGLNLVAGVKPGIDNAAHIGGLLSGLLLGYAFYPGLKWPQKSLPKYFSPALMMGLTVVIVVFALGHIPNYYGIYDKHMKEFSHNEDKALKIYNLPDDTPKEEMLNQLKTNGIQLWERNISLLDSLANYPRMPVELKTDIGQLRAYCELRDKNYQLQYLRVKDDTRIYDDSLRRLTHQIDSMLRAVNEEDTLRHRH